MANVTWLTLGHFTLSGFVDQVILTHLFLFLLRLYSSRPDTLHIITLHVDEFPPRSILIELRFRSLQDTTHTTAVNLNILNLCTYWCVIIINSCLNIIKRINVKCENSTKLDDYQFIIKQF